MWKIYTLKTCDACRKAVKFLRSQGIPFEEIPIRECPPSISELQQLLQIRNGDVRALFNTSGGEYINLGMKDRLAEMSAEKALWLLAKNGNLVKRPVIIGGKVALNGFRPTEWEEIFRVFE